MVKILLVLSSLMYCCNIWAKEGDRKHVITHERQTIVTDPSKGTNSYVNWAVFPREDLPIRQIIMHVTLGTPDSLPTAHWDYKDHINIVRQGGVAGDSMRMEIGRMLTPYGNFFKDGWDFKWSVDVTDFALLLRDSVAIEYIHTGYEPVTVGWALTIDFEIVEGPPHITPLSIREMWNDAFRYGDPRRPITESLTPISFTTVEGGELSRLRIQHTGHGMDRPNNCSEFCSRWRQVFFDGKLVQDKELWKECGSNPLYPQAGTWLYDRALWCPGDLQEPDIIDVYTSEKQHAFSIEMEPYTASEKFDAKEVISSCLIQYSLPHHANDVRIEEIITPNKRPLYGRSNPNCFDARIVVRNLGRDTLKTLRIKYATLGDKAKVHHWKGNLAYYEAAELVLPGLISQKPGENIFEVACERPNGKKDAWSLDNRMSVTFDAPKEMPERFIVHYYTNSQPEENQLYVISEHDTVWMRDGRVLKPRTLYIDTLELAEGAYEMCLTDAAGNGLEYWALRTQGYGYIRILDIDGHMIHKFEPDCGNGETLAFISTPNYINKDIEPLSDYIVYPREVRSVFEVNLYREKSEDVDIFILLKGKLVEGHHYKNLVSGRLIYDISHLKEGAYIVEVRVQGVLKHRRRIHKKK